jgi:PAS domain S-box-containing protein
MSGLSERRNAASELDALLARAKAAEERYTNLFDRLADAVVVADHDGRYVDANLAAVELLGYPRAELLTLSVSDLLAAGPDRARSEFRRFLADGYWRGELDLRRKDGSIVRVDARATPLEETQDGPRYVSILREVGEELWDDGGATASRLAAIVEGSDDAIIGKDLDGIIRSWNRGARDLYGYEPDEVIGRPIWMLAPAEGRAEIDDIMRRLRRGKHVEHFETKRKRKDGRIVDVSLTISPIADATGTIVGASTIARDITARREAEMRLARMAQLTTALEGEEDADQILHHALDAVEQAFGTNRSAALLRDADGAMRFQAWQGLSEGYRAAADGHSPWSGDERDPQPNVVEDVRTEPSLAELLPAIEREGIRSLAFIPLAHQGRLLGAFMACFDQPTQVSDDQIDHAGTISRTVAFWIDRRRTEEALRVARDQLEIITKGAGDGITIQDASGRPVYVNEAAARFSGFESPEEFLAAPLSSVLERFEMSDETGAPFAPDQLPGRRALRGESEPETVLRIRDRTDGREFWRVVRARPVFDEAGQVRFAVNVLTDITGQRVAEYRFRRLFEASIVGIALVDEETVLEANDAFLEMVGSTREELRAGDLRWPEMTPPEWREADERAWAEVYETGVIQPFEKEFVRKDGTRVPVILAATMLQATPYQAVCFVLDTTDRKRSEQERLLLLEQERAARGEAERAREQLAFLLRASELLAASLDYEQTLAQVARLVVPRLADWASVQVLDEDGTLQQLAIAHVDPDKVAMAEELIRRRPPDMTRSYGVPNVIRSGRPEVLSEIPQALFDEAGLDEEMRQVVRDMQIRSTMIVPLSARGRVFGAMSLVWAESGNSYSEDDLPLVEALAARAGLAIDNARLFRERDHISRALQRSLLPPELPTIPGIELAARYRASGEGNEVGGDFYDVFETGRGNWALAIGDVCGKGPEAASLMGVARYSVRTASMQERRPSGVLSILNEAILRQSADGRFCTVCYVRMHPNEHGARLTVCAGGHPLPLVLRADGTVEQVGQPGTLIGVLEDPELTDASVELGPLDALILYTDGVTDEQNESEEFGEARLQAVVRECAGRAAADIAAAIEEAVVAFGSGAPRDDIAILVAKVDP